MLAAQIPILSANPSSNPKPALVIHRAEAIICGIADGSWVMPEQVVGPDQPGRKICILGHTGNLLSALPWTQSADALVLGAGMQVGLLISGLSQCTCYY